MKKIIIYTIFALVGLAIGYFLLAPKSSRSQEMTTEQIDYFWNSMPGTINALTGDNDEKMFTYGDDTTQPLGLVRTFSSDVSGQTIAVATWEAPAGMNVQRSYVHVNINDYQAAELPNRLSYQVWDTPKFIDGHWTMRARIGMYNPRQTHFYVVFDQKGRIYTTETKNAYK